MDQIRQRNEFGQIMEAYKRFRRDYPEQAYNQIYNFCPDPNSEVLDVGAGTGLVTKHLAEHYTHVVGLDKDQAMLDTANADKPGNVSFVRAETEQLPFQD